MSEPKITLRRLINECRAVAFLDTKGDDIPNLADFASACTIHPTALSSLMSGRSFLGEVVASRIAFTLGVSVEYVMAAYHNSVRENRIKRTKKVLQRESDG